MIFGDLDKLRAAIGIHVGYSDWHRITMAQTDGFVAAGSHSLASTGGSQLRPVRPHSSPHLDAPAFLVLSFMPMLVKQVYRIDGIAMALNYGVERARFPAPVRVGSEIRAGVEFMSLVETPTDHRLTSRVTVEAAGLHDAACVSDTVTVLIP